MRARLSARERRHSKCRPGLRVCANQADDELSYSHCTLGAGRKSMRAANVIGPAVSGRTHLSRPLGPPRRARKACLVSRGEVEERRIGDFGDFGGPGASSDPAGGGSKNWAATTFGQAHARAGGGGRDAKMKCWRDSICGRQEAGPRKESGA